MSRGSEQAPIRRTACTRRSRGHRCSFQEASARWAPVQVEGLILATRSPPMASTTISSPEPAAAQASPPNTTARKGREVKGRLRKRRWGWLVWIAVIAAAAAGALWLARGRAAAPVPVSTMRVSRGAVRDFVTSAAAGRVAARQEATLRAEIAGKVQKVHRRRGDRVNAGEPLITYDAAELKERARVADAAVALARAQVLQAEQNAANVDVNLARANRLRESGAIAVAEADTLDGQQKAMARAADAARAGVSQAMASAQLARVALGKAVVLAPFAGTVLVTSVDEGETTAPGAPLLELADVSELHVDAEIDEADLGRVKIEMPADITFDAFPGERIRGTLSEIAPSVTRDLRGDRSVAVDVALPADPRLRVGMSADVDIIVAVREDALFIPPNAVQGRGAERAAFVVKGGVVHKRVIEVGISTWEAVEIRSGLAEGEEVVTSLSSAQVADGVRADVKATK